MTEARFILMAALDELRRPSRKASSTNTVNMADILLAEDDDAMRQFLATALTRAGHKVSTHRDGRQALDALDKRYDLLIADIVMPGVDGIELARRARATQPDLRSRHSIHRPCAAGGAGLQSPPGRLTVSQRHPP